MLSIDMALFGEGGRRLRGPCTSSIEGNTSGDDAIAGGVGIGKYIFASASAVPSTWKNLDAIDRTDPTADNGGEGIGGGGSDAALSCSPFA